MPKKKKEEDLSFEEWNDGRKKKNNKTTRCRHRASYNKWRVPEDGIQPRKFCEGRLLEQQEDD